MQLNWLAEIEDFQGLQGKPILNKHLTFISAFMYCCSLQTAQHLESQQNILKTSCCKTMGIFTVRWVLLEHRNSLPTRSKGIHAAWSSRLPSFQIQFVNNFCIFLYRLQNRRCTFVQQLQQTEEHIYEIDSSRPNGNSPSMLHLTLHQTKKVRPTLLDLIKHNFHLNTANQKFKTLGKALVFSQMLQITMVTQRKYRGSLCPSCSHLLNSGYSLNIGIVFWHTMPSILCTSLYSDTYIWKLSVISYKLIQFPFNLSYESQQQPTLHKHIFSKNQGFGPAALRGQIKVFGTFRLCNRCSLAYTAVQYF